MRTATHATRGLPTRDKAAGGVIALLVLIMAVTACGPASAANPPARRSGLWTITMSPMTGMASRGRQMQVCVDASRDRADALAPPAAAKQCQSRPDFDLMPGGYRFHSICHLDRGMTMDIRGEATGDFQSAYTVKTTTRMTPAPAHMSAMTMTMSARYLGPCPAGMKPGAVNLGGPGRR